MGRRVAITGIGLITPLGIGTKETWGALCAGASGIAEITRFDASGFTSRIAGEVKDFRPEDFLGKKEARRTHLFIAYAVAAARMALDDAGLAVGAPNADCIGVIAGCGLGGLSIMEETVLRISKKGPGRVSPFFIPSMIGNMAAGMISMQLGLRGPNLTVATACAGRRPCHRGGLFARPRRTGRCHGDRRRGIGDRTHLHRRFLGAMKALSDAKRCAPARLSPV